MPSVDVGLYRPGGYQERSERVERVSSASSAYSSSSDTDASSGSGQTLAVEQTSSVELVSYGSILRPKVCRGGDASHLMVLGTDRVLLYAEKSEFLRDHGEYMVGKSGLSYSSRPGTAASRPGTAASRPGTAATMATSDAAATVCTSSPMKQVQGREKDDRMARMPSISLTASVGSAGELMLPARRSMEWSDDEEDVAVAHGAGGQSGGSGMATQCRVAVSLNQLVDAILVEDVGSDIDSRTHSNTLLVIYCPSTNKLNDPNSFKAKRLQLSQSFRRGLSASRSSKWRLPKEILQQVPEESYHFYVRFGSREAAEGMRTAVMGQARKFYECMVWLSKQFPVPKCQSSIMMLTCGVRGGYRGVARDTHAAAFTRAFPALGEEIGLPHVVSHGMCGLARGECAPVVTTFFLQTPLGVATAEVGLMDLEQSWIDGSAPVEVVCELRDDAGDSDEAGEYRWQVIMTFRAMRGDVAIGKCTGGDEAHEDAGRDKAEKGRSSKPVARRQSHGLGAPLVVSLVALRAAKGVIRTVKGAGSRKEKKKAAPPVRGRRRGTWRRFRDSVYIPCSLL